MALLLLVILLSVPFMGVVETSGTIGNIYYTLNDSGELNIWGSGEMSDTRFKENQSITSINISDGIISIGDSVFSKCHNLTEVTISGKVATIGNGAFSDCENLTSVLIYCRKKRLMHMLFQAVRN